MLTERDLRELLSFSEAAPVLSVYLNTNPAEGNADAYRLRLRSMLKDIRSPQDVEAVERYFLNEYDWSGRSVAVFSCAAKGFFRAYPLAIPVQPLVNLGEHPSVKPLADLFENYGGYGVVLVDKQGARVFFFHLGELREQEGVLGENVHHTKRGGASTMPGRRGGVAGRTQHMEEVIERNMKDAVDFAVHLFEENHVRRVLIGGSDDNVAQFRGLLPKAWQSLVMGTFAMAMTATHTEVLAKALQIGREAETQRESRLMRELMVAAAKGEGAVVGLEATLAAVAADRVQLLVVQHGMAQPGCRCKNCGSVALCSMEACPVCGGELEKVPDIMETAVITVLRHGGEVEVMRGNVDLEQVGGIAARLRY